MKALLGRVFEFGNALGLLLAPLDMTAPEPTPPPPPPVVEASYTPVPLLEQQKAPVIGLSDPHAPSTPSLQGPRQARGVPALLLGLRLCQKQQATGVSRRALVNSAGATSKVSARTVELLDAKFAGPQMSAAPFTPTTGFTFVQPVQTNLQQPVPQLFQQTQLVVQQTQPVVQQKPKNHFDELVNFWSGKTAEELMTFNLKTFGWSNDSATNRKLWQFWIGQDLAVTLKKFPKSRWNDSAAVQNELKSYAQHIKRATFVVRAQALEIEESHEYVTMPNVFSDLLEFLQIAVEMTNACRGFPIDESSDWWEAICYFRNALFCEEKVMKGLERQYSAALWSESYDFMKDNKDLWLGKQKD